MQTETEQKSIANSFNVNVQQIADSHFTLRNGEVGKSILLLEKFDYYMALLQKNHQQLSRSEDKELTVSITGEWFLDNYYILMEAMQQVEDALPLSYYRRLPKLGETKYAGHARIYALAKEFILSNNNEYKAGIIEDFIIHYQEAQVLTIGEIWAFPTMLRIVSLENLIAIICKLTGIPQDSNASIEANYSGHLPSEQAIANVITALQAFDNKDWKAYYESVSHVEKILRQDPLGIYSQMDFDTRNRYSKQIEFLAPYDGNQQEAITRELVNLANTNTGDVRSKHVGYYLLDKGRETLEGKIGFAPPLSLRFSRWAEKHATALYIGGIFVVSALILWLLSLGFSAGSFVLSAFLLLVAFWPASALAIMLMNWLITLLVTPKALPKMDFSKGIAPDNKSIIVIPALLSDRDEVDSLIHQLELHYLRNADPALLFALLLDFPDAAQQTMPEDEELLAYAREAMARLNQSHPEKEVFFLFVRERRWNAAQGTWMAWERKRGKLAELNKFLLEPDAETSYIVHDGQLEKLANLRYVITLDADTILPKETAARLIATMAHPLNKPIFNPVNGTVEEGYAILQPRVEILSSAAKQSYFSRIFSPDTSIDLYSRAVSDVYQDRFGEGIYVGKGIYDLHAFEHSLHERIPENSLLSHDLFESLHARTALASDIILLEDYPNNYFAFTGRMHRWIRGDWQLLPWLMPTVPTAKGKQANYFSALDRWKIFDNLRRSLVAPALMLSLVLAWFLPLDSVAWWSVFALSVLLFPFFLSVLHQILYFRSGSNWASIGNKLLLAFWRSIVSLIFLPHEAWLNLNAMYLSLSRMIKRKDMLQWVSSAQSNRFFAGESAGKVILRELFPSILIVAVIGLGLIIFRSHSLLAASPFLIAWLTSMPVAYLLNQSSAIVEAPLSEPQRRKLYLLARRTWLFFEQYVGPESNWLPPDHYQESPRGMIVYHTSPTNIGLLLLSTLAAYDFGYIGLLGLLTRLELSFEAMSKLERHRGHFLNWYDARRLSPLQPAYVSTVDSGNMLACMIALKSGLYDIASESMMTSRRWYGLLDLTELIQETISEAHENKPDIDIELVSSFLLELREMILAAAKERDAIHELDTIRADKLPNIVQSILDFLQIEQDNLDGNSVRNLRIYVDRINQHLSNMSRDIEILLPWFKLMQNPPQTLQAALSIPQVQASWERVAILLAHVPSFNEALLVYDLALSEVELLQAQLDAESHAELKTWFIQLGETLNEAKKQVTDFQGKLSRIQIEIDCYRQEMDFAFLYNEERKVFHIGYNLNSGRLDNSYYDLLASEARIASFISIASNQIPQEHWLSLGRPLKDVNGLASLVSWSGTMFEYLMPSLLLRDYPDTLIHQSLQVAVAEQIAYANKRKIPWGISESGFYAFDNELNYQYRAFGVPSLSFKRGMESEQVISPYASLLALAVRPQDVLRNMDELKKHNGLGTYGFYEAIDFTDDRLPLNQSQAVVREYMAHHQGMLFVAVLNALKHNIMVNRFHADPYIESVEILLQEQMPSEVKEIPSSAVTENTSGQVKPATINTSPWSPEVHAQVPQVHYLSNGNFGTLITSTGAGYSQWRDLALTRWNADTSLENMGTWLYLKEEEKLWSIGFQPMQRSAAKTQFHPHQAEFQSLAHEINAEMFVTVAPEEDVEIRRIRLNNLDEQSRHISFSSYAEVVLATQGADQRHPAFSKLFIETEYLPELNALLFTRRARSASEKPPYMLHMLFSGEALTNIRCEADRRQFLGRNRTASAPKILTEEGAKFTGVAATTLDPIMAIAGDATLEGHQAIEFAYVTIAAETRREVLALARKYRSWAAIERVFMQARYHAEQELNQLNLSSPELETVQKLLSALLYPHSSLRASAQLIASNSKAQNGLWTFGISGDYPILLVTVSDETQLSIIRDLIRAHIYWRQRNIKVTLVILNQKDSGYNDELYKQVHRLIVRMESDIWINRHDGIFLLRSELLTDSDRALLAAASRVALNGENGTVAEQLAAKRFNPIYLPDFIPSIAEIDEATPPLEIPANLAFDNGFGGFDAQTGEYLIYKPTPAPWLNVIANENFGFAVSEAGGGFSWAENSSENRLSAWRNDPVMDMPSEIVYLRDEETGVVWTTSPMPSGDGEVLVRHGFGYSSFEQNSHGLKQKMTMFTAMDAPVKIIRVELENTWERVRRVTMTYYLEWVLGTNRDITQQYIIPEFDANTQVLLAHNPYSLDFGNSTIFVSANLDFHDFTTDRQEFLGRLGNYKLPAGLRRIGLSDTVEAGRDTCAAIQLHMNLEVGQKDVVYFVIGAGANRAEALALAHRFRDPEQIASAWTAVNEFWQKTLTQIEIQTPDAAMNQLLPWLLYQALSCRIWGRSALYQSGGAYGFRDQLQDVMSLIHSHPEIAREHILRAARHQFEEGDVLHWWHPPFGRGVRTRFSDDLLWLPYVTAYYVEATGDVSLLKEEAPFRRGTPLRQGEDERYNQYELTEQGYSIYEHCLRALDRGLTSGKHGLPLMGIGDWNDGMSRVGVEGKGESVWLAWFICATLTAFIPVAEQMDDSMQAQKFRQQLETLRANIEKNAWDGNWYLRAFYDDGSLLGSAMSDECKIDAIAQSWAVISKSGNPERTKQGMESALKYLYKPEEKLILLFTPAFESTGKDPGYIKGYPVGVRENGGQYTHAAIWTVWALAKMGDKERAFELFQMLNPIMHSYNKEEAERYRVEPYVIAADVYRAKPYIGMGGWTWYTGSSGWMYRLALEAILGVQRQGDKLVIEPSIPNEWNSYSLTYRHENAVYHIEVQNHAERSEVLINGERQETLTIPLKSEGEYQVILKLKV